MTSLKDGGISAAEEGKINDAWRYRAWCLPTSVDNSHAVGSALPPPPADAPLLHAYALHAHNGKRLVSPYTTHACRCATAAYAHRACAAATATHLPHLK